jgi:hypothetical protein
MKTVRSQVGVVRVGRRERDLANLGTCCGDGLGGRVIGEIARVLRSSGLLLFDEEARCMLGGRSPSIRAKTVSRQMNSPPPRFYSETSSLRFADYCGFSEGPGPAGLAAAAMISTRRSRAATRAHSAFSWESSLGDRERTGRADAFHPRFRGFRPGLAAAITVTARAIAPTTIRGCHHCAPSQ